MINIDEQEQKIIRELVKNPRASDNSISRNTRVPVMTVNRKRKRLESRGIIRYFLSINTGEEGTGGFHAKELYIVKFRIGITQKEFMSKMENENRTKPFFAEHAEFSFLGEKDGHLALIIILAARTASELMEIFNGKLIPFFREKFGENAVKEVVTANISSPRRMHHNYMPDVNMENGIIKEEWSDDWIFTGKILGSSQPEKIKINKKV